MPEDERVAGKAGLDVPGGPAEPVGSWLSSLAALHVALTRKTCRQTCARTGAATTLAASGTERDTNGTKPDGNHTDLLCRDAVRHGHVARVG